MEKQNREKRKERRRTNTDAERQIQRENRRPKKQRREEKPRDPKQATVFNFTSCTGKFFISLCFAIIIAWVLYTGQFNSLLTGLCIKVKCVRKIKII